MIQIPDAPWVRNPEKYADEYYNGCYEENDEGEERSRQKSMNQFVETLNAAEATEYLRRCGMSISVDTVRLGIQQGQFPFGTCIISKSGSPVCTIYKKLLEQWVNERAC